MSIIDQIPLDKAKSAHAFRTYVWPEAMRRWFPTITFEPVYCEDVNAWRLFWGNGTYCDIASRVQAGVNYESFTSRKSRPRGEVTEFDKTMAAVMAQQYYPIYTIQGYVGDFWHGPLLNVAMIQTVDLYNYWNMQISERRAEVRRTRDGGEEFYVAWWHDLTASGVPFWR